MSEGAAVAAAVAAGTTAAAAGLAAAAAAVNTCKSGDVASLHALRNQSANAPQRDQRASIPRTLEPHLPSPHRSRRCTFQPCIPPKGSDVPPKVKLSRHASPSTPGSTTSSPRADGSGPKATLLDDVLPPQGPKPSWAPRHTAITPTWNIPPFPLKISMYGTLVSVMIDPTAVGFRFEIRNRDRGRGVGTTLRNRRVLR